MSQTIPEFGGCIWPIDPACKTAEWEGYDESVRERALALASATLHRLTGKRVTACPTTVRPGHRVNGCYVPRHMDRIDYTSVFLGIGSRKVPDLRRITLPGPVGRVDSVTLGGLTLAAAAYRVEGNDLVRIDGETWPSEPDLDAPLGSPNTWSVTYLQGYPVDSLGAYAAGVLAMEFAKACAGGKCRLPLGVTQIARQGVNYEITGGDFPGGFTGIREVDSYIALWNPRGQVQGTATWTPGQRPMIRD